MPRKAEHIIKDELEAHRLRSHLEGCLTAGSGALYNIRVYPRGSSYCLQAFRLVLNGVMLHWRYVFTLSPLDVKEVQEEHQFTSRIAAQESV